VIAAGFESWSPAGDRQKPDLSPDSFQLHGSIPRGGPTGEGEAHLTAEPHLGEFTVKNVVQPADESGLRVIFPDVSPRWEGGVAVQFDLDEDNPGDTDNDPDSDDDDDSDEGTDQMNSGDTTDFPGGFSGLRKHVRVTPPLAPRGEKGKLRQT
jgi:hypothetical protein